MPSDGKMACVMTPQGLRLAGQVELAGLDAAPNWQRAEVLRVRAQGLSGPAGGPAAGPREVVDGPPALDTGRAAVLGLASGCADVVHAFGHGHVGLTAGPHAARSSPIWLPDGRRGWIWRPTRRAVSRDQRRGTGRCHSRLGPSSRNPFVQRRVLRLQVSIRVRIGASASTTQPR